MTTPFLIKHQTLENRRKALAFVASHVPELEILDEGTVKMPLYGTCRFAAYTHKIGAMVSSEDHPEFGTDHWHSLDHLLLFREVGDGRAFLYVCEISPLFDKRTIGRHGVTWEDVLKVAKKVFVYKL